MQNKHKKGRENKNKAAKEPKIIVKPVGRFGGLDNIHLALIAVIVLLALILLVVSYTKQPVFPVNVTTTSTVLTNTTAKPLHNATEILTQAERVLASYSYVNSSLNLLPYITNVSNASVAYVPSTRQWLVQVPAVNPVNNEVFTMAFSINDSNISKVLPLMQTAIPSQITKNRVVANGVIRLYGKYPCSTQTPLNVYWFIDPYAPGAVKSLLNLTKLNALFNGKINTSIKIFTTQYTLSVARTYGLSNAEELGKYIFCASLQKNFTNFVYNLNSVYANAYVPQQELATIANESKLNSTLLNSCIANASTKINAQALLAQYYNITQTPMVVVDCKYMSIPQTTKNAVCYANSTICT